MSDSPSADRENLILSALPPEEFWAVCARAEYLTLPAGHTLMRCGDAISSVYFPTSGVVAALGVVATGHHVALCAIGREGFVGAVSLLGLERVPFEVVVEVASTGYRIPIREFRQLVESGEALRDLTLLQAGRVFAQIVRSANCNRFHSHRQRLARWLLVMTDKAQRQALSLTHELLAQLVGGQRHAVTAALRELRARGVIDYQRGRIDVLHLEKLAGVACECHQNDWPVRPLSSAHG